MTWLFSTAIGLGAFLVFVVQPQVGKLVLPLLGGTPAVWNTCLVFFQLSLLGGYFYAHLIARLELRLQIVLHVLVMLLAGALVLPISIAAASAPPDIDTPSRWLFTLLLIRVGAPFVAISATAPLLQRWLGGTRHPHAHDPYFLYAASNTGSLLGLLAYPAAIEPSFSLHTQSSAWTAGYVSLALLIAIAGIVAWRDRAPMPATLDPLDRSVVDVLEPLPIKRRLRWIALAAVPASLMLSVTTHLTTDVAAVPLLWVVPLSVYLLTFVLAFARRPPLSHRWLCALLPVVVLPPLLTISLALTAPWWALLLAHMAALFVVAMVCHGELAADRPSVARLTQFYLWISVGGALGGLFNALVAPLLFHSIVEYPLGLLAACLLRPDAGRPRTADLAGRVRTSISEHPIWRDLAWAVGALAAALVVGRLIAFAGHPDRATFAVALPLLVSIAQWPMARRFALCLAATVLAVQLIDRPDYRDLVIDRNFFGVVKVRVTPDEKYHVLMHGNILHGMQPLVTNGNEKPVSYYGPSGPMGQIFATAGAPARPRVGVVGLGIGTLIAYGQPRDQWTFFEINPDVVRIARDPRYFTYLSQSRAPYDIVMGEGRINLTRQPDHEFDLLVLDAFTSDAIPTHLITREAVQLYFEKLKPTGLLLVNISNKYVSLAPVLGAISHDLGLAGRFCMWVPTPTQGEHGEFPATWVVIGRTAPALGPLVKDSRWEPLPTEPHVPAWTDSYSSLLGVMKWTS
jgi:hypothetical protein